MLRRGPGRPRVVVAVSGVDGSGKSTLTRHLVDLLNDAGIPARRVWGRPGHGHGLRPIARVAPVVKRLLRTPSEVGTRQVAAGPVATSDLPASRRGVLGWLWTWTVTVAYLIDVRRQHLLAAGVVVYDRHVADALVTLDFLYGGARRRVARALIRQLLPSADLAYYLEVDADTVLERNPDSAFGRYAVEQQLHRYPEQLAPLPLERLDGREGADVLVERVYDEVVQTWHRQPA